MDIKVDGSVVYMKGPRNPVNPQPTPEEVDGIVTSLMKTVGGEGSLSEVEKEEFAALHKAQKEQLACKDILVRYCSSCTFHKKAEWFCTKLGDKLKADAPSVKFTGEPVDQKGLMDVAVDGNVIWAKGGFNADDPPPTPQEVEGLVAGLLNAAGVGGGLSDVEKEEYAALHEEQKATIAAK
mmetsp:Transcript_92634/g.288821  ORF Transcript_92634/g.288821 Transcript_92634/m.288821 type:complete len:181 (+) Transcript_92634:234-776(+)